MHRHVGEQRRHRRLGARRRARKAPVLQRRQHLRRDAAADVDAGRGHRPQRQVAGLGAVGVDEQSHGRGAARAAPLAPRRPTPAPRRRPRPRGRRPRRSATPPCVCAAMLHQARARHDVLDVDAAEARRAAPRPAPVRRRCGRRSRRGRPPTAPARMRPSTRCSMASPRPVPAAMSAALPCGAGRAGLQRVQFLGVQHRHGVGHRLEIVQQPHVGDAGRAPRSRRRCTRHGTLVSVATPSRIGPATPSDTRVDARIDACRGRRAAAPAAPAKSSVRIAAHVEQARPRRARARRGRRTSSSRRRRPRGSSRVFYAAARRCVDSAAVTFAIVVRSMPAEPERFRRRAPAGRVVARPARRARHVSGAARRPRPLPAEVGLRHADAARRGGTQFSFQDLSLLRQIHGELQRGVPFRAALRDLQASRQGQLAFDFRLDAEPARIIALARKRAAGARGRVGRRRRHARRHAGRCRAPSSTSSRARCSTTARPSASRRRPAPTAAPCTTTPTWWRRSSTWPTSATPATSCPKRRRSTSARSASTTASSRRTSTSATSTTTWAGTPTPSSHYRRALSLNGEYAEGHFYLAVTLEKLGRSARGAPALARLPVPGARRRVGRSGEGIRRRPAAALRPPAARAVVQRVPAVRRFGRRAAAWARAWPCSSRSRRTTSRG